MPLQKKLEVHILEDSWPGSVPASLTRTGGLRDVDVLLSLLFCAIWTRPPVSFGFSLADCWAWLRYLPAICSSSELRLRDEWTSLDPHQKTVLSGDFGVGFTTWFLHQTLDFRIYADTLWVVNTLAPGKFALGPTAKRGPRKSPDYIAIDGAGGFSALECKGGQTSRASLVDALESGVDQKKNLRALGTTPLVHSLVAGLFIPQFNNTEFPALVVGDPDWNEIQAILREFKEPIIERGVIQIASAKQAAMLDLSQTANTLARAERRHVTVSKAFAEDLNTQRFGRTVVHGEVRVTRDYRWPVQVEIADGIKIAGARFEGKLGPDAIEKLRTIEPVEELAEQGLDGLRNLQWGVESGDMSAELRSPLGGTFRLTLLE
jgi:hypothetical protein